MLKQVELFDKIYDKKQFKIDQLNELEIPINIIEKHSKNKTDKLYKDFNSLELLVDIINNYVYKTTTIKDKLSFELEYDLFGKIQYICGQNSWHIEDTEYTDKVIVHILSEKTISNTMENEIVEATNGKVIIRKSDERVYFKEGNRLFAEI